VVRDPQLGTVAITEVLRRAVVSLGLYPYTPVGHPQRAHQELLKNALDRANNNQTWYWPGAPAGVRLPAAPAGRGRVEPAGARRR
jgi:hypothetical protein